MFHVLPVLDGASFLLTLQVMICLLQYFVESLTVVLPYYPTGTMERVIKEGQVSLGSDLRYHWAVNHAATMAIGGRGSQCTAPVAIGGHRSRLPGSDGVMARWG